MFRSRVSSHVRIKVGKLGILELWPAAKEQAQPFYLTAFKGSRHETHSFFFFFAQMAEVLSGQHSDKFRAVHILDARFDYEYRGGHIQVCITMERRKTCIRQ
jgi:hypothetical protein